MTVLLSFDEEIASEVASVLSLASEHLSSFTTSYPKLNLISTASADDPIQTIFKDDASYSLQQALLPVHDEQLRQIITDDMRAFISTLQDPSATLKNPYSFLGIYEQYTAQQVYDSGIYHNELSGQDRRRIDSYPSLDTYPSKKTLFIKYYLTYIMKDKLTSYIESYIPIQTVLSDITNTVLKQGAPMAIKTINQKYPNLINM